MKRHGFLSFGVMLGVVLAVFFLNPGSSLSAATWYVNPNGMEDFTTIQEALDSGSVCDGDIIIVRAGTYNENINFNGKGVELRADDPAPSNTIIDGQGLGTVVTFDSNEDSNSKIVGFTIRNGSGTYVSMNGYYYGGGVLCDGTSPVIEGNYIISNNISMSYGYGGGICCINGSEATIQDNHIGITDGQTVYKNKAFRGGGIACIGSSPLIKHNNINYNQAANDGGGICCQDDSNPTIRDNTTINFNTAHAGGGIYFWNNDADPENQIEVYNNTIRSNQCTGGIGGGIYSHNSHIYVHWNNINENQADDAGGIYCESGEVLLQRNQIGNNTASDGDGGGAMLIPDTTNCIEMIFCRVFSNTASFDGGGIWCTGGGASGSVKLKIVNNLVVLNTTTGGGGNFGAGIYFEEDNDQVDDEPHITSNTIADNQCTGANGTGGGICVSGSHAKPKVTNCIIWGNNASNSPAWAAINSAVPTITYSDFPGGTGTNVNVQPVYEAGSTAAWYKLVGWPSTNNPLLIDNGDDNAFSLPSTDFEGDNRILDGKHNNFPQTDIGWDEEES